MAWTREAIWLQAGVNARTALLAGGIVRFFTAADVPLGEVTLNSPSHGAANAAGVAALIVAPAITAKATATGAAAKATVFQADGTTPVLSNATVGTAGTDVIVDSTAFVLDNDITMTQLNVQA